VPWSHPDSPAAPAKRSPSKSSASAKPISTAGG
jgi:hypothetical protein